MAIFAALGFGLSAVSAISSNRAEKKKAKSERAARDFSNRMVALSNIADQNTISINEERQRRAKELAITQVQSGSIRAQGAAAVAAATAGVTGQSVSLQAVDIARSAATVEKSVRDDFKTSLIDFDQQRKTIARRARAGLDTSVIAGPSGFKLAGELLKSGVGIGKTFFPETFGD